MSALMQSRTNLRQLWTSLVPTWIQLAPKLGLGWIQLGPKSGFGLAQGCLGTRKWDQHEPNLS